MKNLKKLICLTGFLAAIIAMPAFAADPPIYEITIKDHRFEPSEIKIAANKPAILLVKNLDAEAEEFESMDLKVEKIIAGKSEGKIRLRALKPGRYKFEGEFNAKTAQGILIAE
ncbi:MAG: cupredoxin domain-containing protein [Candidatus Symbiobacter sp.]|nr:cupredoxin domain-containing protein [Candidatus Symbiobacter sp.]